MRDNPFARREPGHLERLTERTWIWRGIVNSTVFVGDRGVAVVDTQVNHGLARRLRDAIARDIGKPILYAVNTHYHWDHTNGNAVFKAAGATLVASRATAAAMVERAPRQKGFLAGRGFELGPDPLQPDVFLDDHPVLDLGGLQVELRRGHAAESADPTLAWCPGERVLAAGDTVMTGSFPIFGQPSQQEGLEDTSWLAALDEVRGFAAAHVTPGHGPVAHAAELDGLERIMRYFLDEVRRHRDAGRDLPGTIAAMEDAMPAWITRIPEVWGTPRYAILRVWAGLEDLGQPGWQHRKPSAIPAGAAAAVDGELDKWKEAVHARLEGGDAGSAVATARNATVVQATDPGAWTLLASTLITASRGIPSVLEKGDCFSAAKDALAKALALDPDHGPACLQLGQFHAMMAHRNGDVPTQAWPWLERAAADPRLTRRERAEVAFYRGIAHRADGDETAAAARFSEAIAADPGFFPARLAQMPG